MFTDIIKKICTWLSVDLCDLAANNSTLTHDSTVKNDESEGPVSEPGANGDREAAVCEPRWGLSLNFSAAQVHDRIYKSFDFNFVSFSLFQQSEWQTQCYDVSWPRCEGGGTLPQTTSEDASRSWGKPLPLVIFDEENSDTRSSLSMGTGVLSIASGHEKPVSQHLLPKSDSTLAKLSNV